MPALVYTLLNCAGGGIQAAGSNRGWSLERVRSRGQSVHNENQRRRVGADDYGGAHRGGPKRRYAEQEGWKETDYSSSYERRRSGPTNGKRKDVWVNPNGSYPDKVFDEVHPVQEFERPGGKDVRVRVRGKTDGNYDDLEGESSGWPERRAAMIELQTSDDLRAVLPRIGETLEVTDMNAVLRRFGRQGKWKESVLLFNWMKKHDKLTAPTYTSFFSVLGKAGQVETALKTFLDLKDREIRSNVYVWNSMLSTLIANARVEKAFQFFRLMQEEGVEPDRITYSTMISGCSKSLGGFYKAQELVTQMRERDHELDSVMYGALINVCAANHMVEEARATFEEMQADGIVPNLVHYSSLLNAYALKGKHEQAEKILLAIKAAGLKPNKVVFNSLINAYARAKQPYKARRIFDEMAVYGLQPDMISFCSLMDAHAKAGQVEEAQELFDQMKAAGLKPGNNSYNILITAYGKSGKLDMIKKLSQEMDQIIGGDLDIQLFNSLLKVYCQAGIMDGVMDVLRRMDAQACPPNRVTFHVLIAYFCKENLCDLAVRTFQDMEARGYPANETSYTILIEGFLRLNKVQDALDLLAEMHKRGASPTKLIYEELISSCVAERMLPEAQQIFQIMKASKQVISQAVLESYLERFAEEGMIEAAKEALDMMIKVGYRPTQDTWDELLFKLTDQKQFEMVIKLAQEPKMQTDPETLRLLRDRIRSEGRGDLLQRFMVIQSRINGNS